MWLKGRCCKRASGVFVRPAILSQRSPSPLPCKDQSDLLRLLEKLEAKINDLPTMK
jgi:hypothetical protein